MLQGILLVKVNFIIYKKFLKFLMMYFKYIQILNDVF